MNNFSSNQRLVLAIIIITVASIIAASLLSGAMATLAAVAICALVFILRPLVMPAGYGKNKIRTLSILVTAGLASSWGAWSGLVNSVFDLANKQPYIAENFPWIKGVDISGAPSIALLVFAGAIIIAVNYFMRDSSIASDHPSPINKDFPEPNFERKLKSFCNTLERHLLTTDQDTNWSPDYYTELQAEVEILSDHGLIQSKKVTNLQEAIRSDRSSQAFLVLGAPGAGKSVALRKLANDMLREVKGTGRIPIYINLREWLYKSEAGNKSTEHQYQPTISDLESFVIESLKDRGDIFTANFLNTYFRDLWQHGRLFFIFDSFDEIPDLLDADENSDIINHLSDVISRFICSNHNSRGLLASRVFRKPTHSFTAQKSLEIRPLTESSILEALDRFPGFSEELRLKLFRDRLDLIPIARNPLLMTLLGIWVEKERCLPQTQAQIYESYLRDRLESCSDKITARDLNIDEVLKIATDIAWFVFNSTEYGIEAPIRVINERFESEKAQSVVEILSFAKIARITHGENKSFAFVHRRFLEYLVTTRLLSNPSDAPLEHIPTDSRGRDALVLFAQLCDEETALKLAETCWSEIQENFGKIDTRLRAIHCLRFLIDAFCTRQSVVTAFEAPLAEFIRDHVTDGDSLILAKICLEGTGLVSKEESLPILRMAIQGNNSWLQETAFRACRHLPKLEQKLEDAISKYIITMPIMQFWQSRKTLSISLSLSESLKGVYRVSKIRLLNMKAFFASLPIILVTSPILLATAIAYSSLILISTNNANSDPKNKAHTKKENLLTKKITDSNIIKHNSTSIDNFLSGIRMVLSVTATATGIGTLLGLNFISSSETSYFSPLTWLWPTTPPAVQAGLILIAGVMTIDWLFVAGVLKIVAGVFKSRESIIEAAKIFAIIISALFIVLAAIFAISQIDLVKKALTYFGAGLMIIFFIFISASTLNIFWLHFNDKKHLKKIKLGIHISRNEIVSHLSLLRTTYGRNSYINRLGRDKINVSGDWPEDFKLDTKAGPAITSLARLEERWLKLDR
ncbi:NACHT domain-containing protein [Pseudomonas sp. JM0905a]|uniref:NACHT domain-containing protein n=1 Tax=Pseudomonas sp. JM0905a TaxID=2772484 RepID=UPI001688BE5A|nr:NACHT domain-containing protein [Pseudomonas sp. JM0905a]MBD2836263.1 NACHT domain-containing protein [Pseudomonas sp. JM0905a]